MASVIRRVRRGNATFQVRWRGPDGRQRAETFKQAAQAHQRAAEVELELARGTFVDPRAGDVLVRDFAKAWIGTRAWKVQTRRRREGILENVVFPYMGDRPIGSIRPSEIQGLVARAATTHAPASVKLLVDTVRPLGAAATRDRLIAVSPAEDLRLPMSTRARPRPIKRVLEHDQVLAPRDAMAPGWGARSRFRRGSASDLGSSWRSGAPPSTSSAAKSRSTAASSSASRNGRSSTLQRHRGASAPSRRPTQCCRHRRAHPGRLRG
jgi:hypothetical protein